MKTLFKDSIFPFYKYLKSRNEREFYRLCDKWGGVERYEKRVVPFLSYKFEVSDCLSFIHQFKDIFVDELYKFETHEEAPLIYDCGSNVGTSCLYFKKLYPNARIKAFEADPQIASLLKKNMYESNIKGVEVIDKALWIHNDGIGFSPDHADSGSFYGDENRIWVDSIRLKELIEKEEKINMLKMDIEGAEVDIILDCQNVLHKVEHIFIEYHSWRKEGQKLDQVLRIMTSNHFRYYIAPVGSRYTPFIDKGQGKKMDLQLNVFAFRE